MLHIFGRTDVFGKLIFIFIISVCSAACTHAPPQPILKNREIVAQVDACLVQRAFNCLDAIHTHFSDNNIRVLDGGTALFYYYRALASYQSNPPAETVPAIFSYDRKHEFLEAWVKQVPSSIAAKIALAQLYYDRGYEARGVGFSKDLTDEQVNGLAYYNQKAIERLRDINPQLDPHTYLLLMNTTQMLRVASDIPTSIRLDQRTHHKDLFDRAIKQFPTYFHYYEARTNMLQTKWYGEKGELAKFAQTVFDSTSKKQATMPAYAFIAGELFRQNARDTLFKEYGLTWEQVRASYEIIQMHYGLGNYTWNVLLGLAVQSGDVSVAKTAMQQIAGKRHEIVYREQKYFDADIAWASRVPGG